MGQCVYTLPSFTFVGGSSRTISIDLYDSEGNPYDLGDDITVTFVMGSFIDETAAPVLTLVSGGTDPHIAVESGNVVVINLKPTDTYDLRGRYIYQISITDSGENTEILGQGGLTILRNLLSDGGEGGGGGDGGNNGYYKGSVATYTDLPSSGLTIGDMYNVADTDTNYVWTGFRWDPLAPEMTSISSSQIDSLFE